MINKYRQCTLFSDSLTKAIERVCNKKDIKKKNNVPKRLPNESFKDYKKRTNQ